MKALQTLLVYFTLLISSIKGATSRCGHLPVWSSTTFKVNIANYFQDIRKKNNDNQQYHHMNKLYCVIGIWKKNISYSFKGETCY